MDPATTIFLLVIALFVIIGAYHIGQRDGLIKEKEAWTSGSQKKGIYTTEVDGQTFSLEEYIVDEYEQDFKLKKNSSESKVTLWLAHPELKYNRSYLYQTKHLKQISVGDKVYIGYPVGKGFTTG